MLCAVWFIFPFRSACLWVLVVPSNNGGYMLKLLNNFTLILNALKPLLHYMLGYKLNQLWDASSWSAIFVNQIGRDDYALSEWIRTIKMYLCKLFHNIVTFYGSGSEIFWAKHQKKLNIFEKSMPF